MSATRIVLRAYKLVVSPLFGPCCRFHPSCSEYAVEALERHGLIRGGWLALSRICRCNSLSNGGIDQVPKEFTLTPWKTNVPRSPFSS